MPRSRAGRPLLRPTRPCLVTRRGSYYCRALEEVAPAAGAAAEKKPRLLRRVPTSLIVTLLGIALTAWLLPAFTRQWDDRQKAHELKTALTSQIATATADALIRSKQELRTAPKFDEKRGFNQKEFEKYLHA